MVTFAIVEADDGFSIIELQPGERIDEVAASRGVVIADPGPFTTLEEAQDALDELRRRNSGDSEIGSVDSNLRISHIGRGCA